MQHALIALFFLSAAATDNHQLGVDLYKKHKYAEAISALEEAAKTEQPGSAGFKESALLIGQSYFQLSQAPKSIPWLVKLPEVNEANYMLGYAYLQTRQTGESEAAFARLFQVPAASAAAHLLAAQMMMKKEFESEAVDQAKAALQIDPKVPEAHFLLAEVAIAHGQPDDGIRELHLELSINPGLSQAWYRLGDAHARQQHWDEAIPNLERAIWLNPDFSGPFILLGRCYFKTGNLVNAEGILRRALGLDPKNASATYLLGQTLMAEGKTEEGRAELAKVRDLKTAE